MLDKLQRLQNYLLDLKIQFHIQDIYIVEQELVAIVDRNKINEVLMLLKLDKNCYFDQLTTICATDYIGKSDRFEIIYHLLSIRNNLRIRLKFSVNENDCIDSCTSVFRCANWYEREIWDLYGIKFKNHPNLDRILTDYNFEGHPLRKDFPLTGNVELRYDLLEKKVIYQPISLTQEFRNFDFTSPWNESQITLPGDEKVYKNSYKQHD